MKLLRYGPKGGEKPGLIDAAGKIRDLSGVIPDLGGETASLASIDRLRGLDPETLPLVGGDPRIGACLSHVPTFHCVGLNYVNHAKESGHPIPAEPVLFNKAATALSGPNDDVIRPKGSRKLDYECELGVVIGAACHHISEAEALSVVSGYCLVNDVSEREFQQERLGQWVKGKSSPTFAPTGPWLVTPDEVGDPQALDVWLTVNGKSRQRSNTSDMIFSVAHCISYMSRFMAFAAGDIVITGTPEGVAMGMSPQAWLVPGDVVELGIDRLGQQRHKVVDYTG